MYDTTCFKSVCLQRAHIIIRHAFKLSRSMRVALVNKCCAIKGSTFVSHCALNLGAMADKWYQLPSGEWKRSRGGAAHREKKARVISGLNDLMRIGDGCSVTKLFRSHAFVVQWLSTYKHRVVGLRVCADMVWTYCHDSIQCAGPGRARARVGPAITSESVWRQRLSGRFRSCAKRLVSGFMAAVLAVGLAR